MNVDPFSVRAGNFIWSLIRQRDYLLFTKRTRRNPDSFLADLTFLRTHLQANYYKTDPQMARFWMHHHERVFNLMPGQGSPIHNSLLLTYLELTREAVNIHMQNLIIPEIKPTNSQQSTHD